MILRLFLAGVRWFNPPPRKVNRPRKSYYLEQEWYRVQDKKVDGYYPFTGRVR